ncbi:hypothetical protein PF007_g32611 [Phytophthora fragariae]|uniref:Secreted protein n=1 Tax=Phytophthora fragariae TaxID=53985 RepID=A0A6A3PGU2_9STRA|nr:hypothetical protein PF007_g32611 [Phytophthora fragariae]
MRLLLQVIIFFHVGVEISRRVVLEADRALGNDCHARGLRSRTWFVVPGSTGLHRRSWYHA